MHLSVLAVRQWRDTCSSPMNSPLTARNSFTSLVAPSDVRALVRLGVGVSNRAVDVRADICDMAGGLQVSEEHVRISLLPMFVHGAHFYSVRQQVEPTIPDKPSFSDRVEGSDGCVGWGSSR